MLDFFSDNFTQDEMVWIVQTQIKFACFQAFPLRGLMQVVLWALHLNL